MRGKKPKRKARLARSELKRGQTPLKRTPFKRKTPLLSRSELKASAPLKAKRKLHLLDDREIRQLWHDDVIARAPRVKGKPVCSACGERPSRSNRLEAHHVTAQETIKRFVASLKLAPRDAAVRRSELLWDIRNGLAVCQRDHDLHTRARVRLPRALVTEEHREFAREVRAEHLLDRYYAA